MKSAYPALCCERLSDDLSGLHLRELPRRVLSAGEVRVAVRAAGVNFPDLLMTRGEYQYVPPLPFVPGMEGAGEVLESSPGTVRWKPGDRVCFQSRLGAFAAEIVVPQEDLRSLPATFTFAEGAAFQVTAMTACVALPRLGRLQAGEALLVHGARGGVGSACVDLGLHLGARVIASASDPASIAAFADRGVALVPARGFREAVLDLTGGRGADVIADPVGGDVFDESVRCIAWNGRLLVLGFASGRIPSLPVNKALIRGFSLVGVRAGEYGRRDPAAGAAVRDQMFEFAGKGLLRPAIGLEVPLREGVRALEAMRDRRVTGKIAIVVPESS